jgi:hypothetical protein
MSPAKNPVLAALARARMQEALLFARWCALNDVPACPAAPAVVARFVADCAPLGIELLWRAIQDISRMHVAAGLADPTLGGVVAGSISDLAGVEPPRSWPAERRRSFRSLPYDLQTYVADREAQRERALRRAQNEAAGARRQLAAHLKSQIPSKQEAISDEDNSRADA